MDLAERRRGAHALHAGPLRPGLGAAARAVGRSRRRHRVPPLPGAETRCGDSEHAAAGGRRLLPSEQLGDRAAPVVERALRVAEVRLRDHEDVPRPGARGPGRAGSDAVAAEPRHEPGLHRQGRLLHRHQAGAARRGDRRHRRREADDVRRAARGRPVPRGRPGQGVAAARVRRAPRRDHGVRGRPGLHRPAHGLARGVRPRVGGARGGRDGDRRAHRHPRRRCGPRRAQHPRLRALRPRAGAGRHVAGRPAARRPRRGGPGRRGGTGGRPVRRSGRPLDGMAHLPRPRGWTRRGVDRRRASTRVR